MRFAGLFRVQHVPFYKSRAQGDLEAVNRWDDEDERLAIRNRFVTGDWDADEAGADDADDANPDEVC